MKTNSWNAERYNRHAGFVSQLALPVVDLLVPQSGESILDLGCGEGTLAAKIAETGAEVIAVDLNADMVAHAKTRGLDAYVMSATRLPFESRFDAVFSNAVLHWVKAAETAVEQVRKVLRPGGRFVAEFGGHGNAHTAVAAMEEVFKRHPEFGRLENPWYFPSPEEYRSLLESKGFRVEYIELIPRPTPVQSVAVWLELFANGITSHLKPEQFETFKHEVSALCRPTLYDPKKGWHVDYVRLRVKAVKAHE